MQILTDYDFIKDANNIPNRINSLVGLRIADSEGNQFVIDEITYDRSDKSVNGLSLRGSGGGKEISIYDYRFYTQIFRSEFDRIKAGLNIRVEVKNDDSKSHSSYIILKLPTGQFLKVYYIGAHFAIKKSQAEKDTIKGIVTDIKEKIRDNNVSMETINRIIFDPTLSTISEAESLNYAIDSLCPKTGWYSIDLSPDVIRELSNYLSPVDPKDVR